METSLPPHDGETQTQGALVQANVLDSGGEGGQGRGGKYSYIWHKTDNGWTYKRWTDRQTCRSYTKFLSCDFIYLFIYFIIVCVYLYMHMYNFLCSDSLLYFFLFLSTLHSVYTRDCSCKNTRWTYTRQTDGQTYMYKTERHTNVPIHDGQTYATKVL